MRQIIVIAHNIRSTHNIGSLLRTCDGIGVEKVYLTGYTPYPKMESDERLPHISEKLNTQIHKTALGAEKTISWQYEIDPIAVITKLKSKKYQIVGLEQSPDSVKLPDYNPDEEVAILLGEEVAGIDKLLLEQCDEIVEIPMFGRKESFNVVQAAAMAMYHLRFY